MGSFAGFSLITGWFSVFPLNVFPTDGTFECNLTDKKRLLGGVRSIHPFVGDFLADTVYCNQFLTDLPAMLPVVSTNMRTSRHPTFSQPRPGGMPKVQPYAVVTKGKGILGCP